MAPLARVAAGNGEPPLTPELIAAFDRLAKPLQEAIEALRLDGWSVADRSLPQVEAEKAARQFGLDVAAILPTTAGGGWRWPARSACPRSSGRPRSATARTPGGVSSGGHRHRSPRSATHQLRGAAGRRARHGERGEDEVAFAERDVESMTVYVGAIGPTL